MRLVREILYIMYACEMFYDPSKSVLQMLQMPKNACKCCCESYFIFLQIWTHFPHSPCILWKCQYECRRIVSNVLGSLINVLQSLQMSCPYDCSRICCGYAFLTNFRSMFLILAGSREYLLTPQECLRTPTNFLQSLRIDVRAAFDKTK